MAERAAGIMACDLYVRLCKPGMMARNSQPPHLATYHTNGGPPFVVLLRTGWSSPPAWWARRSQALFLPNLAYPDGSMGFMQARN